jgi:hypothetical protein
MSRFAPALAALTGLVLTARPADPPEPVISKESYRRAADADIAYLRASLADIAANPEKRQAGRKAATKGVAVLLVRYSEWLGDDALKSQSIRVALKIDKGEWKVAAEASDALKAPKVDKEALKAALPKLTHAAVFAPFRATATGGLNIDRDIKDQTRATTKLEQIDVKLAELLGVRTAALMELAESIPPARATLELAHLESRERRPLWDRWLRDTRLPARDAAIEAAKGEKADREKLRKLLTTVNARCSDCHGCFLTGE